MADPRCWTPTDSHFIPNMKFICIMSCLPKIHSENILYMPLIPNKRIFTPSGTVFSNFIALELLTERLSLRYDVAMTSHVVTMVTKCLNLLAFVQASICEKFFELLSFVYDMYCW